MTIENERRIVKGLFSEILEENNSSCGTCGSDEFLRVVETELVDGRVIPRRLIFQCAPCTDMQGGYSNGDRGRFDNAKLD